ncbi:unnamed protein product [Gongylonema pulchrum]|uniref:Dauer Up-Regulated n=1 Tax=Gongylonema pulchrum TaxID=637853 RepID=A0A183EHM8_9BILA|nr:unnamed protein product [Gongylonema pulchrum]
MKVPVEDVGMAIATMVKMGKEKADREKAAAQTKTKQKLDAAGRPIIGAAESAKNAGGRAFGKIKEGAENVGSAVSGAAHDVKDAAGRAVDKTKQGAAAAGEAVAEAAQGVKDAAGRAVGTAEGGVVKGFQDVKDTAGNFSLSWSCKIKNSNQPINFLAKNSSEKEHIRLAGIHANGSKPRLYKVWATLSNKFEGAH